MKKLGDEIFVQRGEKWTLDFEIRNEDGDPFVVLSSMQNPYCLITVTNADYSQQEEYRESYWLDLSNSYKENIDGSLVQVETKKFAISDVLKLSTWSVNEAISLYGSLYGVNQTNIFDYLFGIVQKDGTKLYSYVVDYSNNPAATYEQWYNVNANGLSMGDGTGYKFQVMYTFDTKDWTAQNYLLDIKIVSGQTLRENLTAYLTDRGITVSSNTDMEQMIELVDDEKDREFYQLFYLSGQPLMNDYDTNIVVLEPTKLTVSTNIQRG